MGKRGRKKLPKREAKRRIQQSRRKYKLKKKIGHKDAFADPSFLSERNPNVEIHEQLMFEREGNPLYEMFDAEWKMRRKKGLREKKEDG